MAPKKSSCKGFLYTNFGSDGILYMYMTLDVSELNDVVDYMRRATNFLLKEGGELHPMQFQSKPETNHNREQKRPW